MFLQDAHFSLRQWRRAPGFTALVVVTLALGIGASAALFSVVNGVLLNPLPYPQPGRLAAVYGTTAATARGYVTYLNFLDWQREAESFSAMAIYRHADRLLTGSGQAEVANGYMVSAGFFKTLGARPVIGDDFRPEQDAVGAAPEVMLGGGFWRRRFGASPAILGRTLDLDGVNYTVIGVMPASFEFYGISPDVYTLIGQWNDPNLRDRRVDVSSRVLARLRPGVTLGRAQSEMDAIAGGLARRYPVANQGAGIAVVSLKEDIVGKVQPYLLLLLGAVGLLLLIACVNVASLLLARATGRRRELALRAALGAGRGRILRQLLSEGVMLALLGGGLGLGLAWAAERGLRAVLAASLPRAAEIGIDGRVAGFTLAVSVLAGVLSGCAPAWGSGRDNLESVLRQGSGGASERRGRLPSALVVGEIALAAILLVGAGLMLRTLAALGRVNPGYIPGHAITFDLALPARPDTSASETRARLRAFDAAVTRLPGVVAESVTLGSRPLIHDSSLPFWIEGRAKPANNNDMPQALFYLAEAGYARAMGLALLRGRFLDDGDNEQAVTVIVIDDVFARRYFAGQDPIGQRVNFAGFGVQARIVGVVGHVKQWGLGAEPGAAIEAEFFYPFMQLPAKLMPLAAGGAAVVVRTTGDPEALVGPVRALVPRLDARETVYAVDTLSELLARSLNAQQATLELLGLFGGLALALAAVGAYGVISFQVGRREREIGIRVALGASRGGLLRMVLAEALGMAICGVGLGLGAATGLARLMGAMLYGVSATDAATDAAVGALLVAVALLAAYLPARRAMRLDPLVALRAE